MHQNMLELPNFQAHSKCSMQQQGVAEQWDDRKVGISQNSCSLHECCVPKWRKQAVRMWAYESL
eukprot:c42906_g1_i1 orf=1-189(-)